MESGADPQTITVFTVLRGILDLFTVSAAQETTFGNIVVLASHIWTVITILAILVSLVAIGFLVYGTVRLYQVREIEKDIYSTITKDDEHERLETSRWQYILARIASTNPDDWRAAIIEADIILDEILTRLGYVGSSVGEKLKAVNPSHFATLNNAWEAHKVRNEIAHQGSAYPLTDRLAYRTIANYEAVFREFEEL